MGVRFVLKWILAIGVSTIALPALGVSVLMIVAMVLSLVIPPTSPDIFVQAIRYVLLFLVTMLPVGAFFGFIQWLALLQSHQINPQIWIGFSTIAVIIGALGFIASYILSPSIFLSCKSEASGMYITCDVADTWFTSVVFISVMSISPVGLLQGFALRRYTRGAWWWPIANVVGAIVALAFYVILARTEYSLVLVAPLSYCTAPIIFGIITGVVLFYLLVKRPKRNDEMPILASEGTI